eukprot:459793-Lingulodinium_polyedra.AAC.1
MWTPGAANNPRRRRARWASSALRGSSKSTLAPPPAIKNRPGTPAFKTVEEALLSARGRWEGEEMRGVFADASF